MALSSYKFKRKNKYITKVNKLFNLDNENFELDLSYFYYLFDRKEIFLQKNLLNSWWPQQKKMRKF